MIIPSSRLILKSIGETLDGVVRPRVTDTAAVSALATVGHMLRHVSLRIEAEGQLLVDDIAALKTLLPSVAKFVEDEHLADDGLCERIKQVLESAVIQPGVYPSHEMLAEHASMLRDALFVGLELLQRYRRTYQDHPAYGELRLQIREYIAKQISEESGLIEPAFDQQGPRR